MRSTAYRLAIESGATDFAAWLRRRRAVILTYHALVDAEPPPKLRPLYKIFVTAAAFRAQMMVLRMRYRVLPLRELAERFRRGESGENLAAVTFDDGWRTTRSLAAPILHELGVPATVFVATGLVDTAARGLWTQQLWASLAESGGGAIRFGESELPADSPAKRALAIRTIAETLKKLPGEKRRAQLDELRARHGDGIALGDDMTLMSWREVEELSAFGVDCGAHTVDHEILSGLTPAEASAQIRDSRGRLEEVTRASCPLFAYPNGSAADFGDIHARILQDQGFSAAVTQIPGRNTPVTDRFRLRRINVGLEHTLETFTAELNGLRHW